MMPQADSNQSLASQGARASRASLNAIVSLGTIFWNTSSNLMTVSFRSTVIGGHMAARPEKRGVYP